MGQPLSLLSGLSQTYSKNMVVKKNQTSTIFPLKNQFLFDSTFTSLYSEMSIPSEISIWKYLRQLKNGDRPLF